MVVDVIISQKNPTDKIFPRTYMDFEQKYQKDHGMNRVNSNYCTSWWEVEEAHRCQVYKWCK